MKHPKVGTMLDDLIARVEAGEISAEEAAQEAPIHRGDSVGVLIQLSRNVDGVVSFLEANGASNISSGEDYIEAYVPVMLLAETSRQPGVLRVRPIQPPGETQGTSQFVGNGPGAHGSIPWNQVGYTGQGIKVGVIDSGFSGLSDLLDTELPSVVQARCYKWLGEYTHDRTYCERGRKTHGTEVAESVMDIAPDVSLYIADPGSLSDLKDTVDWMISEGVSVINHSRTWLFDGPGDGTSPSSISPLNTVDRAVAGGIVWVNAAGNSAQYTWFQRGPFSYSTITANGEDVRVINFEGTNFKNRFHIWGPLQLRWDDTWGRATRDLDLFLVRPDENEITLVSIDPQSGEEGHNPYERVSALVRYDIMVAHRSGSEPSWIQLLGWGGQGLAFRTPGAGSITNPAESANPGMLTVGAAPWNNVNIISDFSSRGPTPGGRVKPDVAAANCGDTATGSRPFCGTSQASPHVAGMAALVRQRFPHYSPSQVVAYLKDSAEQRINSPDPNNTWGHGFIVLPPVAQQPPTPVPSSPSATSITSVTTGTSSLTVAWREPVQTGSAAVTAYDLRHIRSDASSKADANWTVATGVWNGSGSLNHTLTGLADGVEYDIQVRAVNAAGDGPWSATASGTTTASVNLPGVPENLTATGSGQTRIDLSWSAPSSDGGARISGYLIEVSSNRASWSNLVSNTGSASTSYSHTGLTAGSTRHYRVSAINVVGVGPTSNVSTGTTASGGAPGAPIITQVSHRLGSVTVSWQAPSHTGGSAIIAYDLRYIRSAAPSMADGNWTVVIRVWTGSGPLRHELTTLAGGTGYKIQVRAVNGAGEGPWSAAATASTIAAPVSSDATLSGLTVSPAGITGFNSDTTIYRVGVGNSVSQVTVTPTTNDAGATIKIGGGDVTSGSGHTVSLSEGSNVITMTVTAGDGTTTETYTLNADRGSNAAFGWKVMDDFNNLGLDSQVSPRGIWSNGTSMWVACATGNANIPANLCSYSMSTKERGSDFHTLGTHGNNSPMGVTSYGTTMFVSDGNDKKIYAYDRGSYRRDTRREYDRLRSDGIHSPAGLWAGGNRRMWVADSSDGKLYAYRHYYGTAHLEHQKERDAAEDFDTLRAAGNTNPSGIWSDSTTMWVADRSDGKLYAYDMATKVHVPSRDFNTLKEAGNTVPLGIWSDGTTMWVADSSRRKIFSYNMPKAETAGACATGRALTNAAAKPELAGDCDTLLAVRDTLAGTKSLNWSATTPITRWEGVATGGRPERVVRLAITKHLNGEIPSELGNLTNLSVLRLSDNITNIGLRGTIPAELGNLTNLREMDLSGNHLRGAIPAELGNLTALRSLELEYNDLTGTIPSELGNLTNLSLLYLQGNRLSGEVPPELGNLTNLRYLFFRGTRGTSSNRLTGCAPSSLESQLDRYTVWAVGLPFCDTATPPSAPTGLTATADGQTEIDLSWSAPSNNGGANIMGYRIEVSTNESAWSDLVDDTGSTNTSYSHTGLTAGTTRHYRVSAINSAGTGAASNTDSASTTAAPSPDLVVDRPTVSESAPDTGASFTLSTAVRNQGGGSSSFTTLRYYQSGDSTITAGDTEVGTDYVYRLDAGESEDESTSATAPDAPGTYYYGACVGTVSESDIQNNCSSAVTVTVSAPASVPNSPTGLTATAHGQTRIDLAWRTPSDDGGASITGYRIEVSEDNSNWSNLVADTGSARTSYSHTGLAAGSTRHYRVSAINSAGTGSASNVATATTGAAPAPDLIVDRPTVNESAPDAGASFTLSAAVRNQGGSSSSFTTLRYYQSGDSTITASDAEVGTDYVYRLDAGESEDESISLTAPSTPSTYYYGACVDSVSSESDTRNNCSSAVTVTVGAAPAPDLVVDRPTVSESTPDARAPFTLNAAVRNQGNSSSASTTLRYYRSSDSTITTGDMEVGTDSVFGLDASENEDELIFLTAPSTPGTYYYGACVDSVSGESDTRNNCSTAVTVTVSAIASVPNPPTGLTATPNGQTRIDLSWNAPSDDGGAAITGYRIEVSEDGSNWSGLVANTNSTNTSYSHTSLTAGTTRHYRVSAINSSGTGRPSSVDSATTGSEVNAAPDAIGRIPEQTIEKGKDASIDVSTYFRDPDQDTLSYSVDSSLLFNLLSVSGSTVAMRYDGLLCQPRTVTVTAQDDGGLEATQEFTVRRSNNPPVASSGTFPSQTIDVGESSPLYMGNWFSDPDTCDSRLTYSADSSDSGKVNVSASGNTVTVRGLAAGSATVTVTARDSEGLEATLDIQVTVPQAVGRPGVPTGLTATPNGQTRIDLSWNAPSDDGGAAITGYRIEVSEDGSNWSGLVANTNSTNTSYSHTSLTAGTTRHYRVSAINSSGTGRPSSVDSATTGSEVNAAPDAIGRIPEQTIEKGKDASIDVSTYFRDPDQDTLSYSVDSSLLFNLLSVSGSTVAMRYDGLLCQPRTVTVTAQDDGGLEATQEFTVRRSNNPPVASSGTFPSQTIDVGESSPLYMGNWFSDPDTCDSRLTYSADSSDSGKVNVSASGNTVTVRGLAAGSATVTVTARDSEGLEATLDIQVTVPQAVGRPGVPTGLTATPNGQTRIDLSWNAPSDDGGAAITGYRIEVSEDNSNWHDLRADTDSTAASYSHTGIDAGSTRHYRVSAINSAGTGPASNSVNATTDAPEPAEADTCATGGAVSDAANNPGLVSDCETLLAAKDTLRGTATLNWSASTSISQWDAITVTGTPRRVTELDTSGAGLAELTGTIPSELGSLANLTYLRLSNNQLTGAIPAELGNLSSLKWLSLWNNGLTGTIPLELGNLTNLTMLRLEWNELTGTIPAQLGNMTNLKSLSLGGNRLTGTIPSELGNLTNLRSLSLGGSNYGENQLTGTIPAELKNLTKLQSFDLWKNRISGTIPAWLGSLTDLRTLNLAGNQFTGTIPTELGNLTKVGQFWLQDNQLTGTIPAELGNLANATELLLRNNRLSGDIPAELSSLAKLRQLLLANNQLTGCIPEGLRDVRDNDLSRLGLPYCNASTAPGAPTGLAATADGQTEIDLSWSAPSDDGGASISGYRIEVSTDGSSWSDLVANTGSSSTSYNHTGLTANSTRHYRVSAINSVGTGPASNTDSATTEAASAAKPGAPTGLTATADGQTEIDLAWTPPSDDGGASISGYRIEVSEDNSAWSDLVADTNSTATSYSHTGLNAGSTRYYRVSAINSEGTGPVSNVADATTDAPTKPGAPTGLTATANGQTQIDLSWTAPSDDGGADISSYRIEVSTDGSSWSDLVANTNSTATSYSHTGLTENSTRHYRVSAINSAGTGLVSNTDSATTDAAPVQESTCRVNLVVNSGERCTYPGTSEEFWVDSAGTGHFLFVTASEKIEIRSSSINGVTYTFVATKQSDGSWLVEEVG